ncbi:polysaccharide biosynthesis tyrosine autokinase [Ramlibacter monticola]|uniref:Putative tyrosine-protein kinase EpsB n=1 Tax=Ramlibacter monticola TaxID=1926872 RepID=A0A936Z369_9BURK|nr:polysaccharide biosynthesis tyrosine autokinase [Ramlibacter monticola]MBL0394134.1 polysaccharide biosynthesis tyrosine autokinase [Ramlibacter monticola]
MNAPHLLQRQFGPATETKILEEDTHANVREYWDIVVDNRWLIAGITSLAIGIGAAVAFLSRPTYEANLLIQVEDSAGSAGSLLGQAGALFELKTPAIAEIEIIRSRMVIGEAVDKTRMQIQAKPRYLPLVGEWLAGRANGLSEPGFFGLPGYVAGKETIDVGEFSVPELFEGTQFRLRLSSATTFVLSHPELDGVLTGTVGTPLAAETPVGKVSLSVTQITALPGAEFDLVSNSRVETIERLQDGLKLSEKGRQSGIIEARLEGFDRIQVARLLNEIGRQYVQQNVERKAAEAQKTLAFLDTQLPQFKKQLNQAEEAYNSYRHRQGTVALDEEAKLILSRSVELQARLLEAQQKRRDLVSRFTPQHPLVTTLDGQIAAWNEEINALNAKVRSLPAVQQDALRLERDVKVNNELYQQLRNNSLQLQLIREGKIGNVRVIDAAVQPKQPIRPRRGITLALAAVLGLFGGILGAFFRSSFLRGIRNAQEIEARTGLSVYSTIPLSKGQEGLVAKVKGKQKGTHLLASTSPQDPAIESMRSLRTALQFAMLDAPNNRVLITGPTPGVGKSFLSANFAAVVASTGKRVLLIDADLRKGYLNNYFGVSRDRGLSEVIAGSASPAEAIHPGVAPHLDLLTTGVLPPNPAELLMSSALASLLAQFSNAYDIVIIDTPPVLAAADTLNVAHQAGTLLLVARAGETQIGELLESGKRLSQAGKVASGVIFNALDLNRRHYGRYGYRYDSYRYQQYAYEGAKV